MKLNKRIKNKAKYYFYILFMVGYIIFMCGFTVIMVLGIVGERMEISRKSSDYVVATGVVQSVETHWITEDPPGPGEYPDLEYTAMVTYPGREGVTTAFESKQSDKRFRVGAKVKVAYDPNDMSTIDIAYFDILTRSYIPRYMNSFSIWWFIIIGGAVLTVIAFADLLVKFCREAKTKVLPGDFQVEKGTEDTEEETPLTKEQLRARRGGSLICFIIALFLAIFIHNAGIRKLDPATTYTVEATVVDVLKVDSLERCYIFELENRQGEELSCTHFGGRNFAEVGDTFTVYCRDDMESGESLEIVEVREKRLLYIYTPAVICFFVFLYYEIVLLYNKLLLRNKLQ